MTQIPRDRAVDVARLGALLVVMFGHCALLLATIDGSGVRIGNLIGAQPSVAPLTWIAQVMPLFFFAGGAAGAYGYRAGTAWGAWLVTRAQRLYRPVFWYLAAWSVGLLIASLTLGADSAIGLGGESVALLWFLGVYVLALAFVPVLVRVRTGRGVGVVVAALIGAAAALDALRLSTGLAGAAVLNFLIVWLIPVVLGVAYARGLLDRRVALGAAVAAFLAQLALVVAGPDVTPGILAKSLGAVVEDAVNAVGVDLNTASVPLLARVSGISESLAEAIVAHRDKTGRFQNRRALLEVSRLGPKAFEQCAGFLRIRDGEDPLDASGVHPESYPVVRRILDRAGVSLAEIIGNERTLRTLRPADFADERFGVPTVTDILGELEKPGRDPRPAFTTATFAAGVEKVADLKVGMILEGVVTNVAAFGAFVDVGVHQDGLVHVSAMADRFVSDPHEVVRSGQVVRVKVVDVDVDRQRIGLSLRLTDDPKPARGPRRTDRSEAAKHKPQRRNGSGGREQNRPAGSMAQALRDAGFGK